MVRVRAALFAITLLTTPLLGCKACSRGEGSVFDNLTPAEAASVKAAFHPLSANLPTCEQKTPFLCDALGLGKEEESGQYAECADAPELGVACSSIQPLDLGCWDKPPPAASCRMSVDGGSRGMGVEGSMGAIPTGTDPRRDPNRWNGFDPWDGRKPSVTVYLVLSKAGKVQVIRNDEQLASVLAPIDTPGKALQMLMLRSAASQARAIEPRGNGYRAWVAGHVLPSGCSSPYFIETSADIDRAGKLSNMLEVTVPYGEESCSD